MEMTPDRYRSALGFSFQLTFALGIAAVAAWGYAIRDWRALQVIYGLHGCFLLFHYWYFSVIFQRSSREQCSVSLGSMSSRRRPRDKRRQSLAQWGDL